MLRLFSQSQFGDVVQEIDQDPSVTVDGQTCTIIMYTFFIKPKSRRVLVYQRPMEYYLEHFRGFYSIGFGGGLEVSDVVNGDSGTIEKLTTVVESGLREIEEEVSYSGDRFTQEDLSFIGIVDDEMSALIAAIEVDESMDIRVEEPENTHIGWITIDELKDKRNLLEPWSRDVLGGFLSYYNNLVSLESRKSEVWKEIPGYRQYLASSHGRLKNLKTDRISEGGRAGRYLKVSVYPDGKKEPILEYLHILICLAFHGKGKDGQVVRHKNNLRHDCRPSNLKWGTQSENVQDAYDQGLVANKGSNRR